MHKPGYATSEFWITILVSVPAFLVSAGIIPTTDQALLTDAVSKLASGIIAAVTIYKYIHSRAQVKSALYDNTVEGVRKIALFFFLIGSLFLAGEQPAHAQQQRVCFGWRNNAPDNTALLTNIQGQNAQILAQNQQIMAMLAAQANRQSTPTPAPAQPPMIVFAPPSQGGPLQQIPLGGNPYQTIPLGPPPLQQIPLGGPPAQQIPLGPPPQQQIPIGGQPQQNIPLGEQPPQLLPQTPPPPLTAPPGSKVLPPSQSIPLGPPPSPTGYQRYTVRNSCSSALYHSPSSAAPASTSNPTYVWRPAR